MNILVIQNRMGIGDMVIFLPFIKAIADKYNSPVTLLVKESTKVETYTKNLKYIKKIIYLRRNSKNDLHSGLSGFFSLKNEIKENSFEKVFIFNSSLRYRIICKIAGIKNIYHYPLFNKKNLHLVNAAKKFTEKSLKIENCPTETKISIDHSKIEKYKLSDRKKIILGIGSSGPTTKWGYDNFTSLINELNKIGDYYFYLLCGSDEENGAKKIFFGASLFILLFRIKCGGVVMSECFFC